MHGILIRWLILTGAILVTAYLLGGIHVSGFLSAFFAAATLSALNAFLRPVLFLLTLPINILSLGLFAFVINALMLKIASGVIPGFDVDGFWSAIFGSLLISVISWFLNSFINERGTMTYVQFDHQRKRNDDQTIDLKNKGDNHWE